MRQWSLKCSCDKKYNKFVFFIRTRMFRVCARKSKKNAYSSYMQSIYSSGKTCKQLIKKAHFSISETIECMYVDITKCLATLKNHTLAFY